MRDISLFLNNLAGANFDFQNLTNANFLRANLTGAKFRGANLAEVKFGSITGFDSIGSTYYPHYEHATLVGADFGGANLLNVSFGAANLTGVNFRQANLANATLTEGCGLFAPPCFPLTDADLTGADARGAIFRTSATSSALLLPT